MTSTFFYILCAYVTLINVVTFMVYGSDKSRAVRNGKSHKQHRRTPEAVLLLLAAIGGSMGAIVAVAVFHHKTQHKKFTILLPLILLIQIILAYIISYYTLFF